MTAPATPSLRLEDTQPIVASAPSPEPPKRGRLAAVDGLRLIAALTVAVYHYTSHEDYSTKVWGVTRDVAFPGLSKVFAYGWLGVELFFMISGFVICMSSWGRTMGQFAHTRIVRLYPAFWPAVLITATVLTLWPVLRKPPDFDDVLVNLTMFNAPAGVPSVDPVYWTLWVETRFYLLFALVLLWRGLTLKRTMLFAYGWLVCALLSIKAGLPLLTEIFVPNYAAFFTAGIGFYLIHRFGGDIRLWGLVAFSYALGMHSVADRVAGRDLNPKIGMALLTVFFVIMAAVALGWTSRIQWGWLTTAGLLTYPFYLLHEYLGWTIIYGLRDFAPRYVIFIGVLLTMLLAAWLLHRWIEKPLARVLKNQLNAASQRG